jgi:hypothetical protein
MKKLYLTLTEEHKLQVPENKPGKYSYLYQELTNKWKFKIIFNEEFCGLRTSISNLLLQE